MPSATLAAGPTLSEIVYATGCTPRVIRAWVSAGLIPKPGRHGPLTSYQPGTIERVQRIIAGQDRGMSLADIAQWLEDSAPPPVALPATPPAAETPALAFLRSLGTEPQQMATPVEPQPRARRSTSVALPLPCAKASAATTATAVAPGDGTLLRSYAIAPNITVLVQTNLTPSDQRRVRELLKAAERIWSTATTTPSAAETRP